jgi:glucose/arabinose dehydrogenase
MTRSTADALEIYTVSSMTKTGRQAALLCALAVGLAGATLVPPTGGPLADPLPDIPLGPHVLRLTDLVSDLVFPTDVAAPPDGSPRLFVTQFDGKLWVLVDGSLQATPFLDFSDDFFSSSGSAMSSVVFHPDFAINRRLFVVMIENEDPALADFGVTSGVLQQSVLYEVAALAEHPAAGSNLLDPASKRELLRINELSPVHNMNDLAFGSDGYLYITKGDDSSGGTDLTTIHGSVLRIDVDFAPGNAPGANGQYAIPADNPFVGTGGGVIEEIWAYGFRNPWRMTMDTADVWIAEVGEGDIEEIDLVVAGGNYGWMLKQGSFAHLGTGGVSDDLSGLPPGTYIDPVGEYDHGQLDSSVIGGVIYSGAAFPHLVGDYIFGDWTSGRLFQMDTSSGAIQQFSIDPSGDTISGQLSGFPTEGIIAIEVDADGELLIVVSPGDASPIGRIVRVVPANWDDLGGGVAGIAGEPVLLGAGPLLPGSQSSLSLSSAAPGALSTLVIGVALLGLPFKGGLLVPTPDALFSSLPIGSNGSLNLAGTWPAGIPSGLSTYYQFWISDAAGPAGFAASNGVRGTTP